MPDQSVAMTPRAILFTKLTFRLLCCLTCGAVALRADPKVLVNAIPTGAMFAGVTPLGLPFTDAEKEDPTTIERGLNEAIARMLPGATRQGFTYVCLLTAPGDQPIEIPIAAAKATLGLSRSKTSIVVLFYNGGHDATYPTSYSTGELDSKTPHVSTSFEKIAVPPGGSTAGWVYFNLSRVQAEAERAKSQTIFLTASGTGVTVPVPIPGMKQPLMVADDKSKLSVSWSISAEMAASRNVEVLGHSISKEEPKPKTGH